MCFSGWVAGPFGVCQATRAFATLASTKWGLVGVLGLVKVAHVFFIQGLRVAHGWQNDTKQDLDNPSQQVVQAANYSRVLLRIPPCKIM